MSEQERKDMVTLVGVKADGTEHVLGQATMPPKMKARELIQNYFGPFDGGDDDGSDGAMAYWAACELIDWMEKRGSTKVELVQSAALAPQASQSPAVGAGWQPIDTAPKDGTMLLLAGDNFGDPRRGQHVTVGSWRNERGWWDGLPDPVAEQMTANTQLQHLTHWMPIPSAPAFDVLVQHKEGA